MVDVYGNPYINGPCAAPSRVWAPRYVPAVHAKLHGDVDSDGDDNRYAEWNMTTVQYRADRLAFSARSYCPD
jgi:hypothetical protein